MKNLEASVSGLERLTLEEMRCISGGETVICHYDGRNKMFYAVNAIANGIKWIKHWITNDDLYITTIHDDGTRDEPVPYPA